MPAHQSSNYGSKPTARYRRQHYCWHQQRLIFLLCCCNTGLFVLPVKNELSRPGFQALALCEWAEVLRSSDCESDCWRMVVGIPGMWYGAREKSGQGRVCVWERYWYWSWGQWAFLTPENMQSYPMGHDVDLVTVLSAMQHIHVVDELPYIDTWNTSLKYCWVARICMRCYTR